MGEAKVHYASLVSDLIDHILYNDVCTLIICSTRAQFLEQLTASIAIQSQLHQQDDLERLYHAGKIEESDLPMKSFDRPRALLTKSIGLLARSRKIKLAFCPSIDHLRAYLSVFALPSENKQEKTNESLGQHYRKGCLAILDLIAIHSMTSEFSAQGLSQTLAIAVEAASTTRTDLMLCECNDAVNPQNAERGERLWDLHVPLLSSTAHLGDRRSTWSGRRVSVKRVAQRWFHFEDREAINADEMII